MFDDIINFLKKINNMKQLNIDENGKDADLIKMLKIEHKDDWEYVYLKLKKII